MPKNHDYDVRVAWTGRHRPEGGWDSRHEVSTDGPPTLRASADPAFGGERGRWNPEQTFTAALAQCHMLTYLSLCAAAGIEVVSYVDDAHGTLELAGSTGGHFREVLLRPQVRVAAAAQVDAAIRLHDRAHALCFLASSVNFAVKHEAAVTIAEAGR